ncbi:hypothetical protein ACFC1T_25850 [Kitasatospora sp. NPDC056076]|uniref:hypothetical protein n=1 Tax=Kitasatospora sp. NPDC056076 TaxID=3345703 RepID=UPI0035DA8D89
MSPSHADTRLDVADFQDIGRLYAPKISDAALVEFATAAHLATLDAPTEPTAVIDPFLTP